MPHAAETLRSGCCRSGVVPSEGHRRDPLEMSLAKCNVNSCREGGKQAKSPLELAVAQGAAEPGVIISQQCAGPLSALTAPDLQAAPRNAAADVLQMLHRHVAIICQQYKSPPVPSGPQTHTGLCGFHGKCSTRSRELPSCLQSIREEQFSISEPSQPGGRCDSSFLSQWMQSLPPVRILFSHGTELPG